MYRKHHDGQLSIEEFHVPFGSTLDPNNRWVVFSTLMPWEELEETYAPQFSPTTGAPAKSVRLAFAGVPSSGVKPPAPPPRLRRGGPRTSGDRLHGWRCKRWAGPFPWFEYHLNQTNHTQATV